MVLDASTGRPLDLIPGPLAPAACAAGARGAKRTWARARALRASTSRFFGGALDVSSRKRRAAVSVTSSTAPLKAASFAREGRLAPLSLRTNCTAASLISSSLAGGSKCARHLMLRAHGRSPFFP